jgi:hypothetical protein
MLHPLPLPKHINRGPDRERREGEKEGRGTLDKLSCMQYQKFLGKNLKKQLLIYSPGIK